MGDHHSGSGNAGISAILDTIRQQLVTPIEADDLGRLAQLHQAIKALVATLKRDAAADADTVAAATDFQRLLEALIIGEAVQPEAGHALIGPMVDALGAAVAGDGDPLAAVQPQVLAATSDTANQAPFATEPSQPERTAPPQDLPTPNEPTSLPATLAVEPVTPGDATAPVDDDNDLNARAEEIAAGCALTPSALWPTADEPIVTDRVENEPSDSAAEGRTAGEASLPSAGPGQETTVVSPALTALRAAVETGIDPANLTSLAQAHSHCEQIAADAAAQGGPNGEQTSNLAGALAGVLGGMILDDVKDVPDALAALPAGVACLAALADGNAPQAEAVIARLRDLVAGDAASESPEPKAATEPDAAAPAPAPPPATEPVAAPRPPATSPATVELAPYQSTPLTVDLEDSENLQGFVDEAREHIDAIEAALLDVEQAPGDSAKIDELFRPFHTVKGIAGFLNLRDINCLTHEAETILDMGRKGTMQITPGIIDVIFSAIDVLKAQIDCLAGYLIEPTGGVVPQPPCEEMVTHLRQVAAGMPVDGPAVPSATPMPAAREPEAETAADQPPAGARESKGNAAANELSIRVDTAKLDALVDTVGELVIAQTMVNMNSVVDGDEGLRRGVTQVTKIVRDVQETAMGMRMLPVGMTFQKMKRVVRDVARKAGKQVELVISGEETELDKNVIQQIADPLVHMVRNSVDHGIEPPDQRRSAGKSDIGYVHLDAFHEGDSVIIEIRDDGRGLDPQKLIKKGIERGVIGPDDQLSDQQAFALIMAAGFSTAEQVTDISGRGVGMDVVRRNVEEELRGKIEIESALGRGSTFRIKLPLTLAIIDGMLIRIGQERVVMPTIMIEQSLRPDPSMITTVQRRGEMLRVRGELCPLVQLGEHFGYCGRIDPTDALVVVASSGAQKIGIVVSELIGQQQIVIKSLGQEFKRVEGVSGAAILGDGRVGLILEPAGLLALHKRQALSGVGSPTSGRPTGPDAAEFPPAATAEPDGTPADERERNEDEAAAAATEASAAVPVA